MSDNGKKQQTRYLLITEERTHSWGEGYYHQFARVVTDQYESGRRYPYGLDDTYSYSRKDPLYTGLQARCQGDTGSRKAEDREQAVYGSEITYHDVHTITLGDARRMALTLEKIERGLDKLSETRGYTRSWPAYLGRLAEVLGCKGMVFDEGKAWEARTGYRYRWMTIGEGITRAAQKLAQWQDEGKPQEQPAAAESEVQS